MSDNGSMSLFGDTPGNPDMNTLLSLKLLGETGDKEINKALAQEQTRFLTSALALLKTDTFLRLKFGGAGLKEAMKLAEILKKRANEKHLEKRIDKTAEALLDGQLEIGFNDKIKYNAGSVIKHDKQNKTYKIDKAVKSGGGSLLFTN